LDKPDDWAKALLDKEKYTEWEKAIDQEQRDNTLSRCTIMLELMKDEENEILYKPKSIIDLQQVIVAIT